MTEWTEEQNAAIGLRGTLLVAAAAGSGKTAVLVERLIRRITDPHWPVDVDRLLVVTFTKAAAHEMQERVRKALEDALFNEVNQTEAERLFRQLALLAKASITNLHSFCNELLKQNFHEAGLDPGFQVIDAIGAQLLQQDVLDALFEKRYEAEDAGFLRLVEAFGSDRDDYPLMEKVIQLYDFAHSDPYPEEWLRRLPKAYIWDAPETFDSSDWSKAACLGLVDDINLAIGFLEKALEVAEKNCGPLHYVPYLHDEIAQLQALVQIAQRGKWQPAESALLAVKFEGIKGGGKKRSKGAKGTGSEDEDTLSKQLSKEAADFRNKAKKKLADLKNEFASPLAEQIPRWGEMVPLIRDLTALVTNFTDDYALAKRERNVVDFTDLEHLTLKLLEMDGDPSPLAQSLQDRFVELMVDEYQDTNPVQERLLQLLSRSGENGNLFMVGDVKQSIYRFRMADPNLFLAKYNEFPHWQPMDGTSENTGQQSSPMVIDLARNFRSRIEIINGVNFLFKQIMTPGAGEIAYDDHAALKCGAAYISRQDLIRTADGPIEIHLLETPSKSGANLADLGNTNHKESNLEETEANSDEDILGENNNEAESKNEELSEEDFAAARLEARQVSSRIQLMVGNAEENAEFQIFDKDANAFRAVRYSDIVVLMRSSANVTPIFLEEMQKAGIPIYADAASGYFSASEVEVMLALLQVVDNPWQDIPLAAVLRSPLVGLNGTELGRLRCVLPTASFYEAWLLAVWASFATEDGLLTEGHKLGDEIASVLSIYQDQLSNLYTGAKEILAQTPRLGEKLAAFWFQLEKWRTFSRRNSLGDLLEHIYKESNYLAYVGTLPGGIQRQANLRALYDRALRFESTQYRGLFRFLRFLEKFKDQGKDMGNARILGEKENVVRLMTVHASKGLEFPVVFLVGTGKGFNAMDLKGKALRHAKLGLGLKLMDVENRVQYPSIVHYAVKQLLKQEMLAEELRILYVALTRAKERLLIFGTVKGLDEKIKSWGKLRAYEDVGLPDAYLRNAKCFLDWIGTAVARHPGNPFGVQEDGWISGQISDDDSQWTVHIYNDKEKAQARETSISDRRETDEPVLATDVAVTVGNTVVDWDKEVAARLSWGYPYMKDVSRLAKTSVSEIKRHVAEFGDENTPQINSDYHVSLPLAKRPKFLQDAKKLTTSEQGIALHTAMQHLPFRDWSPNWRHLTHSEQLEIMSGFLDSLVTREILSFEERSVINPGQIAEFLNSSLGNRLLSAEEIRREVPFTLSVASDDTAPQLVQGVIDALLFRDGTIELIDYKSFFSVTDRDPEKTIIEKYTTQLAIYTLAVERLLQQKVSRCTIYAFGLGREIAFAPETLAEKTRECFQVS